ncbi:MAG TPA: nucleotide exchange factor GrpE [Candidatus Dojkabacteria bacterium]|nr:nucleotide exchange factor GrpE [Candidatus Dojkabacteria bacterium]
MSKKTDKKPEVHIKEVKTDQISELEKLQKELQDLKVVLQKESEARLQALADYQNFRKRMLLERQDLFDATNNVILLEVIETLDDCRRALKHQVKEKGENEGVQIILGKLQNLLKKFSIEEKLLKEGDNFDPSWMEAIGVVTLPEGEKQKNNTVVNIDQAAFINKNSGQLVRNAKVIIGKYQA